jgi:hypothetical protein
MKISTILVLILVVVATPANAHDVSGCPGNPVEAWDCGATRVELNKHATRSYDLVFSEGITFFGPKSGINFIFGPYGQDGVKLNGKRCRKIKPDETPTD